MRKFTFAKERSVRVAMRLYFLLRYISSERKIVRMPIEVLLLTNIPFLRYNTL